VATTRPTGCFSANSTARPDVCVAFPGRPGCPNVGFTYQLNTALLTAGMITPGQLDELTADAIAHFLRGSRTAAD